MTEAVNHLSCSANAANLVVIRKQISTGPFESSRLSVGTELSRNSIGY